MFVCAFNILTWECASRHNGVHFFNISTAKSVPRLRCFVHFDFGMCFVPQRRALFNISTSKSVPNPSAFNTFDFEMCFAPQRRARLRTRRFSEPTLRPSGATNHWKNSESRLFYLFARPYLLSSDSFSSLIFFLLLFSSLLFSSLVFSDSTSAFSSVHIVGSLTSKLPYSIMLSYCSLFLIFSL